MSEAHIQPIENGPHGLQRLLELGKTALHKIAGPRLSDFEKYGYIYISGDGHAVLSDAENPSDEEWAAFLEVPLE